MATTFLFSYKDYETERRRAIWPKMCTGYTTRILCATADINSLAHEFMSS